MLLGTPVITSSTSSIPEIAGDAAILVDPYDTRQISDAIRALDSDQGLRSALVGKGLQQARRFSTEKYLERLQSVYEPLM